MAAAKAATEPRKVGRPSMLTDETRNRLRLALLDLNTLEDAARFAGISSTTLHRWLATGRQQTRGEYRELWDEVQDALSAAKRQLVRPVMKAARTDAKVALEVLARRFPKEWARTQKVELDDKSSSRTKREGVRDRVVASLEKIEQRLSTAPAVKPPQ